MDILRGIETPAWIVGSARGFVECVLLAAVQAAIVWFSGADVPVELQAIAPIVVLLLGISKGIIDHVDPLKQRVGSSPKPDAGQ